MMFGNYLEDEYKPAYETWKANPTPESNLTMLQSIDPIVQKGVKMYGGDSPLAASRGRLLALDALRKYDPTRSRLQSHVLNQMQGLRRITQQQSQVIKAPERVLLESQRLRESHQELSDELGREPTDAELTDKLGISMSRLSKIRKYQPGISSGRVEELDPMSGGAAGRLPNQRDAEDLWAEIVYQDLNPIDQKIMELSLGMRGQGKLSNQEIARKLNRSPGAITQRKIKIQQLLDQERDLSPFIAE
jgi:DNA-directed RNA polymerase specialized sigma subunit